MKDTRPCELWYTNLTVFDLFMYTFVPLFLFNKWSSTFWHQYQSMAILINKITTEGASFKDDHRYISRYTKHHTKNIEQL